MPQPSSTPLLVWIGESIGGFVAAASLLWSFVRNRAQRREETKQDAIQYTQVAFEGFDDLLTQLRAELTRREDRERELIREIASLRSEVAALRQALIANNIPVPSSSG